MPRESARHRVCRTTSGAGHDANELSMRITPSHSHWTPIENRRHTAVTLSGRSYQHRIVASPEKYYQRCDNIMRHAAERSTPREVRRHSSNSSSGRSHHHSRRRAPSSRSRCPRIPRKQCYIALLLGSVLANVVQLVAFFLSRPNAHRAWPLHSSYRKFVGVIAAPFRSSRVDSRALTPGEQLPSRDHVVTSRARSAGGGELGHQFEPSATAASSSSAISGVAPATPPAQPLVPQLARMANEVVSKPSHHPRFRVAFTVPWIGKTFPSWFPYFLSSCRRSAFIADWLIFHEGAQMPATDEVPTNVIFHDLGRDGLSVLFGTRLAQALGIRDTTSRLVQLFQIAFHEFAYIVTEYKPTHGTVFEDYLRRYSHWSYTDIDMLIGDLPLHIELEVCGTRRSVLARTVPRGMCAR